jgi:hypothetical protein
MVEITFEIKGKAIDPESMRDVLDILFLKHLREELISHLGSVHCEKHGREPTIKVKGQSLDNLTYEVSGCCNDFIEKIEEKIN